jgi:hypothetical protein
MRKQAARMIQAEQLETWIFNILGVTDSRPYVPAETRLLRAPAHVPEEKAQEQTQVAQMH